MTALRVLGFIAGLLLTVVTIGSVASTTVVPRGTRMRTSRFTARTLDLVFSALANRVADWRSRDTIRAFEGPAFVLAILAVWLLLLLAGFALMLWVFVGDLGTALRVSGSSMFTLGIASADGAAPTILVFAAAATGLVVIALQIGYLPALYAAFNRRETLVTVLAGVAGSPAWGPEIIARHAISDSVELLPRVYERWTDWAADVAESHQAYPVLLLFRSPSPDRSWVVSLLAVMDAAALHLALAPISAPADARRLLSVGILAMHDLHRREAPGVVLTPVRERTVHLSRNDFDLALERMTRVGFVLERTPDEGWAHFCGWRINYEEEAYRLCRIVDAVPAVWSGPRVHAGRHIMPDTAERTAIPDERTRREVEEIFRNAELRRAARRERSDSGAVGNEPRPPVSKER